MMQVGLKQIVNQYQTVNVYFKMCTVKWVVCKNESPIKRYNNRFNIRIFLLSDASWYDGSWSQCLIFYLYVIVLLLNWHLCVYHGDGLYRSHEAQ